MKIFRYCSAATIVAMLFLFSCTKAIIDEGEEPIINTAIKYSPDIEIIMFNHCITCHGGPAPNAGVSLTNYQDVRFYAESRNLIQRINDTANPMPPSGLLTSEQRQKIVKWMEDGFPED